MLKNNLFRLQIKSNTQYFAKFIITFLMFLSLSGCAGTKGSINQVQSLGVNAHLNKYDGLLIKSLNIGTAISSNERMRIVELVKKLILEKDPNYFNLVNDLSENIDSIEAVIMFRRYEKGNAFARFISAGLGQIHIDADLVIKEPTSGKTLGKYTVNKTFAWGGAYGAATDIKDVEEGFAEAVVSVLFEENE
jgi:hypothetical protein